MRSLLLLALVGCAEPTWIPDEPPPPYGAVGTFEVCSTPPQAAGEGTVFVENTLEDEVMLTYVDGGCVEYEQARIAPGARWSSPPPTATCTRCGTR
jgi:hypothetical protein